MKKLNASQVSPQAKRPTSEATHKQSAQPAKRSGNTLWQ